MDIPRNEGCEELDFPNTGYTRNSYVVCGITLIAKLSSPILIVAIIKCVLL